MKVTPLALPEVKLIDLDVFEDDRGAFTVHWHDEKLLDAVDGHHFRQDSYVMSKKHVVRGMHYQLPPYEQGKLVRCMSGVIQDVVVDIRKSSPRFGQWVDVLLYSQDHQALWVPPGFAHGYATLEPNTAVFYKCTDLHAPSAERSILWNDKDLDIDWEVTKKAIVSAKDSKGIPFKEAEVCE
jgi:dTDP-4-dehydrorhamnose 3,5-epimerase